MGSGNSKPSSNNAKEVASSISGSSDAVRSTDSNASNTSQPQEAQQQGQEESKCPMHQKDGSYSFDWRAVFRPSFPHGPGGAKPMTEQEAKAKIARRASALDGAMASPGGGCPVQHREYNVYSQPIDPTNNMPHNPNQLPAAGQSAELSTHREKSNIPKGGATGDTTWTYPSPQMFYNALARKGKLGDTKEEDITSVVALHNNMNEKTWRKVLEWEQVTGSSNDEPPKLLKFTGRPKDLSPKAWLKHNLLGHPLPYDRHDWTVVRKDGNTVRYVIDYYYDDTLAQEDTGGMPKKDDPTATPSLLVDVRPAVDGPFQLWDRAVTMPYAQLSKQSEYSYLPLRPTDDMRNQVKESVDVWKSIQAGEKEDDFKSASSALSEKEIKALIQDYAAAVKDCRKAQTQVDKCKSDDECQRASLDLTICMGKTLCPLQHASFTKALTGDDESSIQFSLERLGECVVFKSSHEALNQPK